MSTVVVIAGSAAAARPLDDLTEAHRVSVISPSAVSGDTPMHVIPAPVRALPSPIERAITALRRSALGRNLVRLSPFDESRRLWRAVRNDSGCRAAIASADILVAADRNAIITVWNSVRRVDAAAVYGAAAARSLLTQA